MELKSKVTAVKPKKTVGHISLNSGTLSEAKDFKLKEKVTLEVEVEITSLRTPDQWDISEGGAKPTDVNVGFDLLGAKVKSSKAE